jgi:AcrR family transcriptional regulator
MPSDDQAPGLRERKKIRTRETLRREAYRLFELHGYADTTVEQIAEAADVSPSTFFRYFAGKATLLVPDQFLEPIIENFLKAPPEMSPIAAYRLALQQFFSGLGKLDPENWQQEAARQRLLYTAPEAAGALYHGFLASVDQIAEGLSIRLSRPIDDPELRIAASAMMGVMMTALHGAPMELESLDRALAFLEAGLPLTGDD